MGKVISERQLRARGQKLPDKKTPEKSGRDMFKLSPISVLFIFFGFAAYLFLIAKFQGTGEPFWDWTVLLFWMGIFGILGGIGVLYWTYKTANPGIQYEYVNTDLQRPKNIMIWIFWVFLTIFIIQMAILLTGAVLKFSFGILDMYFYYIGAAIMEELFFRYFLTTLFYFGIKRTRAKHQAILLAPFFSAIPFMLAHGNVYGDSPFLMITMFLGGYIFAITFLVHKDISINMGAHALINLIGVFLLYQGSMGVI